MPWLESLNVGPTRRMAWQGRPTGIDKRPVEGPVLVQSPGPKGPGGGSGLAGDGIGDIDHHGGVEQAVYAYAREDLDFWAEELDREIRDGQFGENLTTEGIDLTHAPVGARLGIGDVVLEIAGVRTPCNDFKTWMGLTGFDSTAWVKRFTAEQRPGPYLRVVSAGPIVAGDAIAILHEPTHGVTVRDLFIALHLDRSRLPELLALDALAAKVRRKVDEYLAT